MENQRYIDTDYDSPSDVASDAMREMGQPGSSEDEVMEDSDGRECAGELEGMMEEQIIWIRRRCRWIRRVSTMSTMTTTIIQQGWMLLAV
ncbi:unnamed protein product [Vitrella brassicaformis CCMP3155]|uniref:Uncharacterized protein n=1 Tax=Vitrella brassicaformis (strain CCMP3155) TaxID=1169540 RepID=A0A0G4EBT0_VITBC|nr:unnamed protein product [Vitrella brassicaformis CCMP3155]|eukprot:CEL93434.1 unnamed protein product [Vitrella brassicaformis CCMP3155]